MARSVLTDALRTRFEDAMDEYDDTHLIEPWIALQKRMESARGEARPIRFRKDESALISAVGNLEEFYPERAYAFALEVTRRTDDPELLAALAFGTLGRLIYLDTNWALDRLREDVPREPRLRQVLQHVYEAGFGLSRGQRKALSALLGGAAGG